MAYYALFHAICGNYADSFVGGALKDIRAWNYVCRSVEHGFVKRQFTNNRVRSEFPYDVQLVARTSVYLQYRRHKADYDPAFRPNRVFVQVTTLQAGLAIRRLKSVALGDRKALAVWTVLKKRHV